MRLFSIILCCAVQAVLGYDGPPPLTEVDGRSPIRMGGEMLGGYRSYYVHRGEKMGADSTEGQISGGASLSDSWAGNFSPSATGMAAISVRPLYTGKSSIIWRTNARPGFLSTGSGTIPVP